MLMTLVEGINMSAQSPALTLAQITYQDPETAAPVAVPLEASVFVALAHLTAAWGRERALALLQFGAALVQPELSDLDIRRLELALTAMERYIAQWNDRAELALAISYEQLRGGRLSDNEASLFAAALLEQRIGRAAWRRRVDRWATRHGLPPVEEPRQASMFDAYASDRQERAAQDLAAEQ